jgi:hypothetical protein
MEIKRVKIEERGLKLLWGGLGRFFDDRSKDGDQLVGLIQEISKLFFGDHFCFN